MWTTSAPNVSGIRLSKGFWPHRWQCTPSQRGRLVRRAQSKRTLEQAVDLDVGEHLSEPRVGRLDIDPLEPLVPWSGHEGLPHRPRDKDPGGSRRQTVGDAIDPKRHV